MNNAIYECTFNRLMNGYTVTRNKCFIGSFEFHSDGYYNVLDCNDSYEVVESVPAAFAYIVNVYETQYIPKED